MTIIKPAGDEPIVAVLRSQRCGRDEQRRPSNASEDRGRSGDGFRGVIGTRVRSPDRARAGAVDSASFRRIGGGAAIRAQLALTG